MCIVKVNLANHTSAKRFYVYELRDSTGVPFYVGKGQGSRLHIHEQKANCGFHSPVCCKIRKLIALGVPIQKAVVFSSRSETAVFAEEVRWIALYGRKNLKNQTDGGEGPKSPTAETRAKIVAGRRRIVASVETLRRLRASHLGLRHTKTTCTKIAATMRGSKHPWAVAVCLANIASGKAGFKGRKWSNEHRRRFRLARLGHVVTQETRDKISKSKKLWYKNNKLH